MLYDEKLLSIDEAGKTLPGCPSRSTIWRWCRVGVKGIRLEYRRVGRRIFTSREALERFTRALAEADEPVVDGRSTQQKVTGKRRRVPSAAERERQIAEAERLLEEAGI